MRLLLTFYMGIILSGCVGAVPPDLGVRDGNLAPCPESPNCVSSQSEDPDRFIEPLRYGTTAEEAMADLKGILGRMKRARIMAESSVYLHVTFTSFLFRFVDDVEFSLDDTARVIHVRSASRTGYSDLGVNRRRVEKIRTLWETR